MSVAAHRPKGLGAIDSWSLPLGRYRQYPAWLKQVLSEKTVLLRLPGGSVLIARPYTGFSQISTTEYCSEASEAFLESTSSFSAYLRAAMLQA